MLVAGFVEIARLQYAPSPGNYYDEDARNNITPCQSIDDFNPYNYQVYFLSIHFLAKPMIYFFENILLGIKTFCVFVFLIRII